MESECPSNDTIAELVCRQLGVAKADEVEAHVADCAPCRRLVGTLAAGSLPRLVGTSRIEPTSAPRPSEGRYVVKQELARGGMGRISIAEDTLLGRTVAIKELLAPTAELAARFRRELALTSRLQHPAIVSVHDGGEWPSGEPFYVMRLVSGEPLDHVIGRQADVAARLGLLPAAIAMVDALAYAHAQGIIHRDLKPANVLVGDYGETVVIDWGLAKDLRAEDDEPGDVVGTPAYMSPEQARGERVDERGDVYALGAVLYHLLGGVAPYGGESADTILRAVCNAPPPALADRARGIPADLLTIVAKAMARAPGDRYATAKELAIELKRFERGQLVEAHRYSAGELVRRWIRRHRTAVGVGVVATAVLAFVVAMSVRRIVIEEHRAEQRRADAEELMRFMLTTLHDRLKPIGKLDLLGTVADKEQAYYAAHTDDLRPSDRFDRAIALGNLAEVLEAHGDATNALAEFRAALALSSALAAEHPTEWTYQHQVSAIESHLGELMADQDDAAGALRFMQAASAVDQRHADQLPDDDAAHDSLALGLVREGHVLETLGKTDDALRRYRSALAIATRFAARAPTARNWAELLAESHERVGNMLLKRGDAPSALVEERAALATELALAARIPDDMAAKHDIVAYHLDVGGVLENNDPAGALVEYRDALAVAEAMIAHDATNMGWQRDYSITQNSIGTVLLDTGDTKGALAAYEAALASVRVQVAAAPTNAAVQRELMAAQMHIGTIRFAQGDKRGARPAFEAALAIAQPLATANPTNINSQRDLSAALGNLGSALFEGFGDAAAAVEKFRASIAISRRLVAQDPTNTDVVFDVSTGLTNLGDALAKTDGR